jgi:putative ABC transport system permease protein
VSRLARTVRVALFVTWRSLTRGNIGVTLLTLLVMSAVYIQLIFVPSLIEGANEQIRAQLRDHLTANIVVSPSGTALTIPDPEGLVADAQDEPHVSAVTPTVMAGSQVSSGARTGSWSVLAVEPESFARTFTTPEQMIEGEWLEPGDTDQIVLGIGIAGADLSEKPAFRASLQDVHVGDEVQVAFLGGATRAVTVAGIYETGFAQADQRAFLTRQTAESVVPQLAGKVSAIYLRTEPVGVEQEVIDGLMERRPDVTYESWTVLDAAIADLTKSFDVVGKILGAVSLAVAVIVVFIVTYIDLVSKRRTIGIQRAIGITNGALVLSYVMRAIVFAAMGVVAGGLLFAFGAVPLVQARPFEFPVGPVTLVLTGRILVRDALVLVGVAVFGALVPAYRSVRMNLLDAIWG